MKQVLTSILYLGGIGFLFGIILSILDKKLRVKEEPLVKEILDILPGINCGACGYAGCEAYAKEVAKRKDVLTGCIPGGESVNNKVASLLGVESRQTTSFKIIVLCAAKFRDRKISFDYRGPGTCSLAHVGLGSIDCRYGCLGFGDCVEVCPTRALKVEDGLVKVDYKKCIGCGKCAGICPRNILKLVRADSKNLYVVSCSNPGDALYTKKVCSCGCIGCGICVKIVKESPFYLDDKLSKIDYDKINKNSESELDTAVNKCPVKIIDKFRL